MALLITTIVTTTLFIFCSRKESVNCNMRRRYLSLSLTPPPFALSYVVALCHTIHAVAQNIGDLRLTGVGSNSTAGRLELFYTTNSSVGQPGWGTISAVNFSKSAADVACHQLGYSNAESFFLASTYVKHVIVIRGFEPSRQFSYGPRSTSSLYFF